MSDGKYPELLERRYLGTSIGGLLAACQAYVALGFDPAHPLPPLLSPLPVSFRTLHSLLLVPYFSWKYTHAAHHKNTNSCEHDEVFVPATRAATPAVNDSPLAHTMGLVTMLTVGWFGYMGMNITGPAKYAAQPGDKSHFGVGSALWKPALEPGSDAARAASSSSKPLWVAVSDVGLFGAFALIALAVRTWGLTAVVAFYGIPYLIVNAHLVLITFLQHTDIYVPHFREREFSWLRGALCTVDRSFSRPLDALMHHITDTHVAHHLFSHMPFYHAAEATAALKAVLGPYYLRDETPVPAATWRAWTQCRFVEDHGDIVFYQNAVAHAKGAAAAGGAGKAVKGA